jgi:hypothetical protein
MIVDCVNMIKDNHRDAVALQNLKTIGGQAAGRWLPAQACGDDHINA